MNYIDLFAPHHIATLADWLAEKGEVFLQIELPHSGGSGLYETVRSLADLKRAIQNVGNPEIEILIWRHRTLEEFESDDPFEADLKWIYSHPDEVMYLSVKKNLNSSASYLENPAKYQKESEEWFK